jgi:hypothetical protein
MEDSEMLESVGTLAEQMLSNEQELASQLVRRWFGHKVDFGHV